MTGWRWAVLSDGWTEAPEAAVLDGGSWTRRIRFHATAVLLDHPGHGHVLFDTGYSSRFATETERWPYRLHRAVTPVTLTEPSGIAGLLRRRRIDPERLRRVVISHWHADHIGGLRDFPRAEILAHPTGWHSVATLRGVAALRRGFLPGLVPEDAPRRMRWVHEGEDVFGDGSMRVLEFPGHAPGQIGLRFIDHRARPVLLAADACWLSAAYRDLRMPHPLTRLIHDWKAYRQSLVRLNELHRTEGDLVIVPCHCPETAARVLPS